MNHNYALVGFASLMLFVGMIIFVVWLAKVQFSREYDTYDIVFDTGRFEPRSQKGRTLLAHELAHTIQQKGSRV